MEVSIGQRAARLYADGPGNLSPLKGAHLAPNRWSTACGRGYILSPLRGSLGCVKYVDASRWERHERSECKRDSAQQSRNSRSECKRDSAQQSRNSRSECKRDSAQQSRNSRSECKRDNAQQ